MNDQLITALAVTALITCVPLALLTYIAYRLLWDAYDWCMQHYKRYRNRWLRINRARIDCNYRVGQYITPKSQK